MRKKAIKLSPFIVIFAIFIIGGLLLWDWRRGEDDSGAICHALKKDYPTDDASKIIATGKFTSHNESFIYIGDIVEFKLRVLYDDDRVEVKERSILNFNLSPYKVVSQGEVVSKRHSQCSEKSIHFTLQALDVDPGSKNRFEYLNSEGHERTPQVEYAGDGLVRTIVPSYEAPYVVTVTDGEITRVPDNSEKYPLFQKSEREKTWQDTARFYIGIAMILGLISWIGLTVIIRKRKRAVEGEVNSDLAGLFPELFGDGDSHERLVRAYFRLEEILEQSLREKVARAFSSDLTKEQEEEIILELREYVKGRHGNDGLA